MESDNIRLYFQLQPDDPSRKHLLSLQDDLPPQQRGRKVPANRIHLTLIHFGKANDVFEVISQQSSIDRANFQRLLGQYILRSQVYMPNSAVLLQPLGFGRFGDQGGTLVVEYQPDTELLKAHASLYDELQDFLQNCGITDVAGFIADDHNFKHAPVLRPHVTLYKGYSGNLPQISLQPVRLTSMHTVYPPVS